MKQIDVKEDALYYFCMDRFDILYIEYYYTSYYGSMGERKPWPHYSHSVLQSIKLRISLILFDFYLKAAQVQFKNYRKEKL